MNTVIAPWHASYAPDQIGGSVFAVPADDRLAAARQLHAAGLWIHCDVMIDGDGRSLGITIEELLGIREALPAALLDVHLIVLDDATRPGSTLVAEHLSMGAVNTLDLLEQIMESHPQRIVLPPAVAAANPDFLSELRPVLPPSIAPELPPAPPPVADRAGVAVWVTLAPTTSAGDIRPLGPVIDGIMVMLIQPGTSDIADQSLISRITELSDRFEVGADGGITEATARACFDAGADYVVSGRALLTTDRMRTDPMATARIRADPMATARIRADPVRARSLSSSPLSTDLRADSITTT